MKNYLLSALAIGTLTLLASCDKEVESTNLQVDLSRTITVKGYVYAELDNTKNGLELAPAGTIIRLSVNYNELAGGAGSGKWIDSVSVDANGMFTAEVPVDDDGVTLNVDPIEFEGTLVKGFGSNPAHVNAVFTGAVSFPLGLVKLSTTKNKIIEITYNATPLNAGQEKLVKVKFIASARLDDEKGTDEKVSESDINLYIDNEWATIARTDINGEFILEVPYNKEISLEFSATKRVSDGIGGFTNVKYTYNVASGPFTSKQETAVYFGGGQKSID